MSTENRFDVISIKDSMRFYLDKGRGFKIFFPFHRFNLSFMLN